jgi:hypothetical protein
VLFFSHLQGSALGSSNYYHRLGIVATVHSFVDIEHIVIGDVVVLTHLFVVEKLFANLSIEFLDAGIQLLLLLCHFFHPFAHVTNLPLDFWVLVSSDPLDGIFLSLLNVVDSLKHVGYIVDSTFLNSELVYS